MRTREVGFGSNENQTKTQISLGQIFQKFDSLLLYISLSVFIANEFRLFLLTENLRKHLYILLRVGIVLAVIQIGVHLKLNRHANNSKTFGSLC